MTETNQKTDIFEFIKELPKVELHVHLEGCVTPEFWLELIKKNNPSEPAPRLDELEKRFQIETFDSFIEAFRDVLFTFKTPGDFYDLTTYFLTRSAKQNVRYCEVMLTPWFVQQRGIDLQEMMSEIDRAAREAEKKLGIVMKLIFDGPRNFGNEVVREVYEMAVADKTGRVIGVGLGGDEKNYPARLFTDEFDFARSSGLEVVAHAGETDGEKSMMDAIELLKVSRIGHCLGIDKSSRLEEKILEEKITLELCPWSNVATGSLPCIEDHPLPEYLKRGYPVTLNSDDPGIFGTSLNKEFETMAELHGLTQFQLTDLSRNAVLGSFLSLKKKEQLHGEINEYQRKFGAGLG